MDTIPDATTVAFFRERLRKAGLIEEIVERSEQYLRDQGYEARGGQIIDATIVPAPRQRKSCSEYQDIKEDMVPDSWQESPEYLCQKDLDGRWTKKHFVSYYSYNNGISVDAEHEMEVRYGASWCPRQSTAIIAVQSCEQWRYYLG